MKADLAALDHKYRARRTGQSPMEYACAVEVHQRASRVSGWAVAITLTIGFCVAIVAGVLT